MGTEFVGTSITSDGDGSDTAEYGETVLAENPHIRFFNNQRGYVRCDLTPERWQADYRVLPYVQRPGAPVTTRASFVIGERPPRRPPGLTFAQGAENAFMDARSAAWRKASVGAVQPHPRVVLAPAPRERHWK